MRGPVKIGVSAVIGLSATSTSCWRIRSTPAVSPGTRPHPAPELPAEGRSSAEGQQNLPISGRCLEKAIDRRVVENPATGNGPPSNRGRDAGSVACDAARERSAQGSRDRPAAARRSPATR